MGDTGQTFGLRHDLADLASPEAVVARLRRLHDGEEALHDVAMLGDAARGPLQALLTEREPSGIYQPRILAARALGTIHAEDILLAFLKAPRFPDDPVERAGEEAVVNGAAEVLAARRYAPAFPVLKEIVAGRPHLIGSVHALASYDRAEAIPELIAALGDDGSRHAAHAGLVRIGPPALAPLMECIQRLSRERNAAFETNRRHRHGALLVLADMGLPDGSWPLLAQLMNDPDRRICAAACGVMLRHGPPDRKREAGSLLSALWRGGDLRLRIEIEMLMRGSGLPDPGLADPDLKGA